MNQVRLPVQKYFLSPALALSKCVPPSSAHLDGTISNLRQAVEQLLCVAIAELPKRRLICHWLARAFSSADQTSGAERN